MSAPRGMMSARARQRLMSALALLGFFVLWELACVATGVSDLVLPRPSQILQVLIDKLPLLFAHARRSMAVLRANIVIALAIKLLFFVLALAGVATLWMAVFADVGASLLVIGNGLRLARARLGDEQGKETT